MGKSETEIPNTLFFRAIKMQFSNALQFVVSSILFSNLSLQKHDENNRMELYSIVCIQFVTLCDAKTC